MSGDEMKVECTECTFSEIVCEDDDVLPADVIIEHGRDTGHKLSISDLDDRE